MTPDDPATPAVDDAQLCRGSHLFEIRLILGLTGWESDPVLVETVVWSCTVSAILIGDIANQLSELGTLRRRNALPQGNFAVAAE